MRYRIGSYTLDRDARFLSGADGDVHVEPQVFDVLCYLIEARDRAVAKSELLDEVWGDQFVSESALTSRIKSARAALGDDGRRQDVIRTVHGFGYQFVHEVDELADSRGRDARAVSRTVLPSFAQPLRGRDAEANELVELIGANQLVSIVGPGGMGKTHLAVEVARTAAGSISLPAAFVDLATIHDADAVPAALVLALGIETGQRQNSLDAAAEYLAAVPHLVVLDNCEHVLDGVAATIACVVAADDHVRIVTTSREPLGVANERVYRLGVLPTAADALDLASIEDSPAAALFLDRARLIDAGVLSTDDHARLLGELCARLDGLPLAIELAAGRVAAFDLPDLLAVLDRRLDVIADRSSTRDHRHRTLRATVDWSYQLLTDDEQRLLRTLAVFPAGVTVAGLERLDAHLALDRDVLESAARLVDASLLIRSKTTEGSRYNQLETLRTFGLEQLDAHGERQRAQSLAAHATLDLLDGLTDGLRSRDEARWVRLVRAEFPNIRATRRWLDEHDHIVDLVTLSKSMIRYSRLRDSNEIWAWSDDLLDRVAEDHPQRAAVLAIHAQSAWRRGDNTVAIDEARQALAMADAGWAREQAWSELGSALLLIGDFDGASAAWEEEASESRTATGRAAIALVAGYSGQLDRARQIVADARGHSRSTSEDAWLDYVEAEVANTIGAADVEQLRRAIAQARSVESSFVAGVAMVTLASVYVADGDIDRANATYEELIRHWLRSGSWTQLWTTLRNVAELIADSHPATSWEILIAADDDANSPAVDEETRQRLDELIARLLPLRDERSSVRVPRAAIAERALTALAERQVTESAPSHR
ncbi:MAG: winged helix-turn-helix domain-containing protein [Actinomycetota bacterium]